MPTTDIQWLLVHREATSASPDFVWSYLTDVSHWDDPPARFTLNGQFESGARGTTAHPDQEPVEWVLRDVQSGRSYRIESVLQEEARLVCEWMFEPLAEGGTTLRQRMGVAGAGAADRAEAIRQGFGPTLAEGMQRIARMLDDAAAAAAPRDAG